MNKKIAAVITAVMTMVVMCGAPAVAFALEGNAVTKEETVYVVTDSQGVQNDVIVSDHLINNYKVDTIADKTNLSDIENVKGKETFKQNGDKLIWNANGNDIFYQGRTDKEIPVTMKVRYFLDGKEISGKELQGKSGKVAIKIRYTNNAKHAGQTVPIIVMSGMIVTDNSFTDIKIDNGKIINMGDKQVVAGMAAPGIAESMGIAESDMGMGSSIEIRGTAKKFAVKDIMTIATNDLFDDVDTSKIDDLNYDKQIKELDSGAVKLVKGSRTLSKGLQQLNAKVPQLSSATGQLNDGGNKLVAAIKQLSAGVDSLITGTEGINKYATGIQSGLNGNGTEENPGLVAGAAGVKKGADGVVQYSAAVDADMDATIELINTLYSTGKIDADTCSQLINSLRAEKIDMAYLSGTADAVASGAGSVSGGLAQLQASVDGTDPNANPGLVNTTNAVLNGEKQLKASIGAGGNSSSTLYGGAAQLAAGLGEMNTQAGTLASGVSQLNNGAGQLSKGMQKLYKEGIKKIVDLYNDEIKGLTSNLSTMVKAGKGYKTFTILPDNIDGNVKFIYKTTINK